MTTMESETQFSPMQMLKRRLYAMRNGIVADSMRHAGCPYRLIFGLNLPQLTEIAAVTGKSAEMAESLWNDSDLRESALIAPMIYPVEALTPEKALEIARKSRWVEDADIISHRLLSRTPFAAETAETLAADPDRLMRYLALRIMMRLAPQMPERAAAMARAELARTDALTSLATSLADNAAEYQN